MQEVNAQIAKADDKEIYEIIQAVIGRYQVCFPDWEIMFLSLPKGPGREKALEETIAFLRKHR